MVALNIELCQPKNDAKVYSQETRCGGGEESMGENSIADVDRMVTTITLEDLEQSRDKYLKHSGDSGILVLNDDNEHARQCEKNSYAANDKNKNTEPLNKDKHSNVAYLNQQLTFENSFWNTEICNFDGWDKVVQRLRSGRQVLKEYIEFLKQRAAIEDLLGKSLIKLSKSVLGSEEIECFDGVWKTLQSVTEVSGLCHIRSSIQLNAEASKMSEAAEIAREKRKPFEEIVRGYQQMLRHNRKRVTELKKNYQLKAREEVVQSVDGRKDNEKVRQRHFKSQQSLRSAERSYETALKVLDESRQCWEQETSNALIHFHSIEEDRLSAIRDSIWRMANVLSSDCVEDDHGAEDIRQTLEDPRIDVMNVMNYFIKQFGSGNERPSPIIDYRPIGVSLKAASQVDTPQNQKIQPSVNSNRSTKAQTDFIVSNGKKMTRQIPKINQTKLKQPESFSKLPTPVSRTMLPLNSLSKASSGCMVTKRNSKSVPTSQSVSPTPDRPNKPPRMLQYTYPSFLPSKIPTNKSDVPIYIGNSVENAEYFNLPDSSNSGCMSSDYHSDSQSTGEMHQFDSSTSPPIRTAKKSMINPSSNTTKQNMTIFKYNRKCSNEISSNRNEFLQYQPYSDKWQMKYVTGQQRVYSTQKLRKPL